MTEGKYYGEKSVSVKAVPDCSNAHVEGTAGRTAQDLPCQFLFVPGI